MKQVFLVLERSSQNLQKMSESNKIFLEGVFAEFGVENRNGRIYLEKEYLPHLEYLKKDIANGNLLGELDHPERFEVSLQNVSHRIDKIWYDATKRQVIGRIEVLTQTPKGQIAKALLDAGVPLSISSRAAGTVNDDKTVAIQQIYTYDLVAKPGFEAAQLHTVNESVKGTINDLIKKLNESYDSYETQNTSKQMGILNENVSIIAMDEKYPNGVPLRNEVKDIIKNNTNNMTNESVNTNKPDVTTQIAALSEQVKTQQETIVRLLEYVNELKTLQEDSINWQTDTAKMVNTIGNYVNRLSTKNNSQSNIIKAIVEKVNHNADITNHMQDWVGSISEHVNGACNAIDHNAEMLNYVTEWVGTTNGTVNKLINTTHKSLDKTITKTDIQTLVEWVELELESKHNPELKKKLEEMLKVNSIKAKGKINEGIKGLETLDKPTSIKQPKEKAGKEKTKVVIDTKTKVITAKPGKSGPLKASGNKPKGLKTLDTKGDTKGAPLTSPKVKGTETLENPKPVKCKDAVDKGKTTTNYKKEQKLKTDTKKGSIKESVNDPEVAQTITDRRAKLEEKLNAIAQNLEKGRVINEQLAKEFPFTIYLSESDRSNFNALSAADKMKVTDRITKANTNDPYIIQSVYESALKSTTVNEPLWLTSAPEKYKVIYNNVAESVQNSIKSRAEFMKLDTQYQIDNFWETSGLIDKPKLNLNESLSAIQIKEQSTELSNYDNMIANIGAQMSRFNR